MEIEEVKRYPAAFIVPAVNEGSQAYYKIAYTERQLKESIDFSQLRRGLPRAKALYSMDEINQYFESDMCTNGERSAILKMVDYILRMHPHFPIKSTP